LITMKTIIETKLKRSVMKHALIAVAAVLSCCAAYANDEATPTERNLSATRDPAVQTTDARNVDSHTRKFIQEAAKGGHMEVKVGQLGVDRGQNSEVKKLGERIVKDHMKANEELAQLAQQKGVDITKGALEHHKVWDSLSDKGGADFDKAFTKHMIMDHKKDISKFEKCSKDIQDADVKAFIDKTLPTLREHLQMAQSLAGVVGLTDADIAVSAADQGDNVGDAAVSVDTGTDRDLKRDNLNKNDTTTANPDQIDNSVDNSGKVRTEKGDGKTLGIDTKKGDHKVLGLNTDKNDGKYLGVIPAPHRNKASAEDEVKASVDGSRVDLDNKGTASLDQPADATGAPATVSTEKAVSDKSTSSAYDTDKKAGAKNLSLNDVPAAVRDTIKNEGGSSEIKGIKKTMKNGKAIYRVEFPKSGRNTVLQINEDGTIQKDNRSDKAK